jgi:hypothetical protein
MLSRTVFVILGAPVALSVLAMACTKLIGIDGDYVVGANVSDGSAFESGQLDAPWSDADSGADADAATDADATADRDAAADADATRDGDAAADADADSGFDDALDSEAACALGYKVCHDACVPADPAHGCGSTNCTAIDPMSDRENCGGCNHSCLGAGCEAGLCPATILAVVDGGAYHVAVNQDAIYWTAQGADGGGSLMSIAKDGGALTVVAPGLDHPDFITLDDTAVYWSENVAVVGAVKMQPFGSTEASVLANQQHGPQNIAVDKNWVYWVTWGRYSDAGSPFFGTVMRADRDGGMEVLTGGQNRPYGIALDSFHVYWTNHGTGVDDTGSLCWIDLAASALVVCRPELGHKMGSSGLVVDQGELFWCNRGIPYRSNGEILRVTMSDGGSVSVSFIAKNQKFPIEVAVDGRNVYWTNNDDGTVGRASRVGSSGSDVLILAKDQGLLRGIAVDDTYVYWASTSKGVIGRVAK